MAVNEGAVQVRLLGPVDVTVSGLARPLSGLRRKAVLAVLGLHPGKAVSTDHLVGIVWGERPPATVSHGLQNIVAYLRRVLDRPERITFSRAGYLLQLPPDAVDLSRAESLIRGSAAKADPIVRADMLRTALKMWRGESLSDVSAVPWLNERSHWAETLRIDAVEALTDIRLATGEHAELAVELLRLAEANPFREYIHQQLMVALYRSGRPADALDVYRRLRQNMVVELGTEPSPAVRATERAILRHDVALSAPAPMAARMTPAQLPLVARTFAGRDVELGRLDELIGDHLSGRLVSQVVVVSGTAGAGKTTLVVRWADSVASCFPDGQLYVNLRGFDPTGASASTAEVLGGFLNALGVPDVEGPVSPDVLAAAFRTALAGRRMLIVLDNARDEAQVRTLLPGPGGCLVVVTSRNRLDGLVTTEGAQAVRLSLPSAAEARQMLAARLGANRVDAEPEAVADIIAWCARLPLALAVAAAHPAADTGLVALARTLREATEPLTALGTGDNATDVRTVFSSSLAALTPPAARLFRFIGLCPGPDFSVPTAASLAGCAPATAHQLLNELLRQHLLTAPAAGRYACHDLLREFAVEQAGARESASALDRVRDHYLHTAFNAAMWLMPSRHPITLAAARPGTVVVAPADAEEAEMWLDTELPAILAILKHQRSDEAYWRPWQLAWTLVNFLDRRGRWLDDGAVQLVALRAAEQAGDILGQAHTHSFLAKTSRKLGRRDESDDHRRQAILLFATVGDLVGEGIAHEDAIAVAVIDGRLEDGLRHGRRALAVYQKAGYRGGQASMLNNTGFLLAQLGDYHAARDLCRRALALHREMGDRVQEAGTWDSLGLIHFGLDEVDLAVKCYGQAIAISRQMNDRFNEADSLASLGDGYAAAGRPDDARAAWQQAMLLLEEMALPEAADIRAKIDALVLVG